MSYFKITLHRSGIGMPATIRGTLEALGLRRRNQTVHHRVGTRIAGQLFQVKELVRVEEVDAPMTKLEMKDSRRPDAGFWIEKAVPR